MKQIRTICLIAALALALPAAAQNARSLAASGDKALAGYDFAAAKDDYTRALDRTQDSTEKMVLLEKITWCENGLNMLQYASRPQVLSSITVPRSKFFLYYSHFPDKSWKKGPDGAAFLYTEDMDKVIIPTRGEYGTYDFSWASRIEGDRWSPLLDMGDGINSPEDELYPVLSDDGKKVYFSSKGLYGMGGYDLFVSEWDEERQEWGVAENLGFPYSSPYDDLLFCNTPDGNFSLFASNRACSADSVVIYLLRFDPNPVKTAVESVEQARAIASMRVRPSLNLDIDESEFSHTMYGDDSFAQYFALVGRYSAVKDSIRTLQNSIASSRKLYAQSEDDERREIARTIRFAEDDIMQLQGRLGDISSELQAVEMEFLVRGESIKPEEFEQAALEADISAAAPAAAKPQYTFIQRTMGSMPEFDFATPEVQVDMNFKVLDESVIIEDYKLPEYLVYQIQVATSANKLDADRFKGLSPVFTKKLGSKQVYRIGMFDTWAEANRALATVKKKGFPSASIVAFDKATNVTVKNARALEAKRKDNIKYQVVFKEYPGGIPADVLSAVRGATDADIARSSEGGRTFYFIAPLDKAEAARVRDAALDAGAEGVVIEPIK